MVVTTLLAFLSRRQCVSTARASSDGRLKRARAALLKNKTERQSEIENLMTETFVKSFARSNAGCNVDCPPE